MKLTPEIIWVALTALIVGCVLGYGVRSFVSFLRRRGTRREHYAMQAGPGARMEPQSDQDWRMELESDLSQVTTAPTDDPRVAPVNGQTAENSRRAIETDASKRQAS